MKPLRKCLGFRYLRLATFQPMGRYYPNLTKLRRNSNRSRQSLVTLSRSSVHLDVLSENLEI